MDSGTEAAAGRALHESGQPVARGEDGTLHRDQCGKAGGHHRAVPHLARRVPVARGRGAHGRDQGARFVGGANRVAHPAQPAGLAGRQQPHSRPYREREGHRQLGRIHPQGHSGAQRSASGAGIPAAGAGEGRRRRAALPRRPAALAGRPAGHHRQQGLEQGLDGVRQRHHGKCARRSFHAAPRQLAGAREGVGGPQLPRRARTEDRGLRTHVRAGGVGSARGAGPRTGVVRRGLFTSRHARHAYQPHGGSEARRKPLDGAEAQGVRRGNRGSRCQAVRQAGGLRRELRQAGCAH